MRVLSAPLARTSHAAPRPSLRSAHRGPRVLTRSAQRSLPPGWEAVVDPASGRTYYWDTATNKTQWDPPAELSSGPGAATPSQELGKYMVEGQVPTGQSWDSILDALCQAYTADQSGMVFWETARSFRADRVFEEEYFDWLFHRIREAGRDGDVDRKQRLEKVMARLSNPLLRQPAPFEAGSTGY